MEHYVAPKLTVLGSLAALTLGLDQNPISVSF